MLNSRVLSNRFKKQMERLKKDGFAQYISIYGPTSTQSYDPSTGNFTDSRRLLFDKILARISDFSLKERNDLNIEDDSYKVVFATSEVPNISIGYQIKDYEGNIYDVNKVVTRNEIITIVQARLRENG